MPAEVALSNEASVLPSSRLSRPNYNAVEHIMGLNLTVCPIRHSGQPCTCKRDPGTVLDGG